MRSIFIYAKNSDRSILREIRILEFLNFNTFIFKFYFSVLYETDENKDLPLEDLMKKQICPEWFVRSQPFLGRCVPFMKKNNSSGDLDDIFDSGNKNWVRKFNWH